MFAVEFLELGLGDERERAALVGRTNRLGYHGAAILSSFALSRPRIVRLERSGDWFDGERGERRVGGRMALLATICVGGRDVVFAAVHLESHSDPGQRSAQASTLLAAIDEYDANAPVLIGGDLNTFSLAHGMIADRPALTDALERDPGRWSRPEPHEPLFEAARRAGYDTGACNVPGVGTQRLAHLEPSSRGPLKLDWLLSRGLACRAARVMDAATPQGRALSDHELLEVTVGQPRQ